MDGKTLDGQTLTVSKAGWQTQGNLDSKSVEDSISIDQLKETLRMFDTNLVLGSMFSVYACGKCVCVCVFSL